MSRSATSTRFLNLSRDGDSTTALGSLLTNRSLGLQMLPKFSHRLRVLENWCRRQVMLAACCPTTGPKGWGLQLEGKATDSLSKCPCAQRDRIKCRDSCIMQDLSYCPLLALPKTEEMIHSRNRQLFLNLLSLTWEMARTVLGQERFKQMAELRLPAFTTLCSVRNRTATRDFTHSVLRKNIISLLFVKNCRSLKPYTWLISLPTLFFLS